MMRYAWPGNVRELQNEVHRVVLSIGDDGRITADLLRPEIGALAPVSPHNGCRAPLRDIVREVEVATIAARLREYNYHRGATARSLGITREWLWAKMRELGLPIRNGRGRADREVDPNADDDS